MFRSKIIPTEKIGDLIPDDALVAVSSSSGLDQALAARNKVILVREPSEHGRHGDTARRPVAPESTTTW